jgi:hypothetical protein
MATAGAVGHARGNQTAIELHQWASQLGSAAPHSPEATRKSLPSVSSLGPGLHRLGMSVMRASDPDDTANDLSLIPRGQLGDFNAANRHYEDSHMQSHAPNQQPETTGPTGKPRGFQIHKVQAAAQRAKGNQYAGPDDDGAD